LPVVFKSFERTDYAILATVHPAPLRKAVPGAVTLAQ